MAYDIGVAFIQIVPSFENIERDLRRGARKMADDLGKEAGKALPKGFDQGIDEGLDRAEKKTRAGGAKAGESYAGHFQDSLQRRLKNASKAMPDIGFDTARNAAEQAVKDIQAQLRGMQGIDLDADVAIAAVEVLRERLNRLEREAGDIDLRMDVDKARGELDGWLKDVHSAGERAGRDFGSAFDKQVRDGLGKAITKMPNAKVGLDTDSANNRLVDLRRTLQGLSEQTIGVDINERDAMTLLRGVRRELDEISRTAESVKLRVIADKAMKDVDATLNDLVTESERAEKKAAEERTKIHQQALDEDARRDRKAFEERNRLHQDALDEDVRREWKARQDMARFHDQAIGEDWRRDQKARELMARIHQQAIDEDYRRERKAREDMARLHEQAIAEDFRRDRKARDDMARLHDQALGENFRRTKQAADNAQKELERANEEAFGRTWAGKVRKNIDEAFKALPDIKIDADSTEAQHAIRMIRDDLELMRDLEIGVDMDAGEAVAQISGMRSQLAELAKSDPDIQVRVDALAAAIKLGEIERTARQLDGRDVDIRINANGEALRSLTSAANSSLSRMEQLIAVSISLGTILVPAAAAAAAAIGFIGAAAASATAGIGVTALGFSGIGEAVKALGKDADDTQKRLVSQARAGNQVASSADAINSAERALANTRAQNAESARRAAQGVEDAERGVTRAQQQRREASLDLTRAIEEERRANQDLQLDIEGVSIAQEQATLDLAEAKKELDKLLANPRATEEQRKQAQITYDQISLRMKELALQQERLEEKKAHADKVGVEGSERVQAAQQKVRDTNEGVAESQRRLSEAIIAQQDQQRQAAFALAGAQQSLDSARRQAVQAANRETVAGGEALDNLNTIMGKLSPTAQRFARYLHGLRDEFRSLRDTAADNMLPGVQASIEGLMPYLPGFRTYIGEVAKSIGSMFKETTRFLTTNRTWRDFWSYMGDETVPTMEQLARITGNVATGLIGAFLALRPFNGDVGGGLEKLTERFAHWGETLENNASFERFLDYVHENGPRVVHLIGELSTFIGRFVAAAAPTGEYVLRAFTALVEMLNAIPISILTVLVGLMSAYSAVLLLVNARTRLQGIHEGISTRAAEAKTKAMGAVNTATENYRGTLARTTERTGRFSTALNHIQASAGVARKGMSGLVDFMGGPWGIAIAGASLAAIYFAQQTEEQQNKVDNLAEALALLGKAYKETRNISSTAVKDVVAQSKELQQLINNMNTYGVSIENVARASAGERGAQQQVIAALKARKAALLEVTTEEKRKAALEGGLAGWTKSRPEFKQAQDIDILIASLEKQFGALSAAAQAQAALDAAQRKTTDSAKPATEEQRKAADQMSTSAARIQVLTGLIDAFGNAQSTAAQRSGALRAAIEQQTGAKISAIEAEERHNSALLNLTASVKSNGTSLEVNSEKGLRNRDALEASAAAVRERYLADIEAGVPMEEATRRHEARIVALQQEAHDLGLDKKATDELVAAYGDVPENLKTVYTTKGFREAFEELQSLQVAQLALSQGIPVDQAAKEYRKQQQKGDSFLGAGGLKDGGQVRGPGTRTSDSIPAWLSNGEFVQPARTVDYYGHGLMEAIRHRLIPRDMFPGFAQGGVVNWPARVDLTKTRVPTWEQVVANTAPQVPPSAMGWERMIQILRRVFKGLPLLSGYRPGDRVGSGELSYHARGRAVDLPPRMDVFNWIKAHYPNSRELIFTPAGRRQVWNGREHQFTPDVAAGHWDHVHWGYDQGGWLPPGVTSVFNGTGKPEAVFTDSQFSDISALVHNARSGAGGETHHWHFKEAALDHGRLSAWADARDALARSGRPS